MVADGAAGVKWLDRELDFGPHMILCLDAKAMTVALDHIGVPHHDRHAWPTSPASTSHYTNPRDGGSPACVVCINPPKDKETDGIDIAAMLAHEAYHVVCTHYDWIGEKRPGEEQTAYALQFIASRLMRSYAEQTKERKR